MYYINDNSRGGLRHFFCEHGNTGWRRPGLEGAEKVFRRYNEIFLPILFSCPLGSCPIPDKNRFHRRSACKFLYFHAAKHTQAATRVPGNRNPHEHDKPILFLVLFYFFPGCPAGFVRRGALVPRFPIPLRPSRTAPGGPDHRRVGPTHLGRRGR